MYPASLQPSHRWLESQHEKKEEELKTVCTFHPQTLSPEKSAYMRSFMETHKADPQNKCLELYELAKHPRKSVFDSLNIVHGRQRRLRRPRTSLRRRR